MAGNLFQSMQKRMQTVQSGQADPGNADLYGFNQTHGAARGPAPAPMRPVAASPAPAAPQAPAAQAAAPSLYESMQRRIQAVQGGQADPGNADLYGYNQAASTGGNFNTPGSGGNFNTPGSGGNFNTPGAGGDFNTQPQGGNFNAQPSNHLFGAGGSPNPGGQLFNAQLARAAGGGANLADLKPLLGGYDGGGGSAPQQGVAPAAAQSLNRLFGGGAANPGGQLFNSARNEQIAAHRGGNLADLAPALTGVGTGGAVPASGDVAAALRPALTGFGGGSAPQQQGGDLAALRPLLGGFGGGSASPQGGDYAALAPALTGVGTGGGGIPADDPIARALAESRFAEFSAPRRRPQGRKIATFRRSS